MPKFMNDDQANDATREIMANPSVFNHIGEAFSAIPSMLATSGIAQRHMDAFVNQAKSNAGDLILKHFTKVIMDKMPFGAGLMIRSKVSDEVLGMAVSQVVVIGCAVLQPRLSEENRRYCNMVMDLMVYGCQAQFFRWTGLDGLIESFLTPEIKSQLDAVASAGK